MKNIISGNLETKKDWEKDSSTGWFIGHFINDKIEFKTNDFEVKLPMARP